MILEMVNDNMLEKDTIFHLKKSIITTRLISSILHVTILISIVLFLSIIKDNAISTKVYEILF